MKTDVELLTCFAGDGSQEAFTELVERHVSLVYCAALRQLGGDSHLAKDVTQQVFTALANKARSLSRDTIVLAAWLYVTTHYIVANVRRAERRRQIREHEAFLMRANLSDTPSADDWNRIRPVLDEAVLTLRPADREAILLRFFSDSPFADIGRTLRVSESAARQRVDRALDQLRHALEKRGIESTAGALTTVLTTQAVASVPIGLAASAATSALAGVTTAAGSVGLGAMLTPSKFVLVSAASVMAIVTGVLFTRNAGGPDGAVRALATGDRQAAVPTAEGVSTDTRHPRTRSTNAAADSFSLSSSAATAAGATNGGKGARDLPHANSVNSARNGAQGETGTPETSTTFQRLKSEDPAQFAANLLAAGFSTAAARGAVYALLREQQAPRRAELLASVPVDPYWQPAPTVVLPEHYGEFTQLQREQDAIVRRIFPYERELFALTMQRIYGPLTEEKLERVMQIETQFREQRMQMAFRPFMLPWHAAQLATMDQEKRRTLAGVLTPQELEEYDLRSSSTARKLRTLSGFDPSEQEFRTLFRLISSSEAAIPPTSVVALDVAHQTTAPELTARIKQTLGEERFAAYERASDPGYQQAFSILQRLMLPTDNATQVYQIQRDTQRLATEIQSDREHPFAQRSARLRELTESVSLKLSPLLTPAGLEAYKHGAGAWLRRLERSPDTANRTVSTQ